MIVEDISLQYHEVLNPVLFSGNHLKPGVREHLVAIAKAFITFLKIPEDSVVEIIGTGSSFNYNYHNSSDIDIHLNLDPSKIPVDKIWLNEYLQTKKAYWIARHKISIKGYNVELYPALMGDNPTPKDAGVYSLINDTWINEPVNQHIRFGSIDAISREADDWESLVNRLIKGDASGNELNKIKKQVQNMRIAAIRTAGEYSTGNLVFKELRNRGFFDKINNYLLYKFDQSLSESKRRNWVW